MSGLESHPLRQIEQLKGLTAFEESRSNFFFIRDCYFEAALNLLFERSLILKIVVLCIKKYANSSTQCCT
jgi:hypothetical protein